LVFLGFQPRLGPSFSWLPPPPPKRLPFLPNANLGSLLPLFDVCTCEFMTSLSPREYPALPSWISPSSPAVFFTRLTPSLDVRFFFFFSAELSSFPWGNFLREGCTDFRHAPALCFPPETSKTVGSFSYIRFFFFQVFFWVPPNQTDGGSSFSLRTHHVPLSHFPFLLSELISGFKHTPPSLMAVGSHLAGPLPLCSHCFLFCPPGLVWSLVFEKFVLVSGAIRPSQAFGSFPPFFWKFFRLFGLATFPIPPCWIY